MTADKIECIEEGDSGPTIALLRRLGADVRMTIGDDLGSVWFEPHADGALTLREGTLLADGSRSRPIKAKIRNTPIWQFSIRLAIPEYCRSRARGA